MSEGQHNPRDGEVWTHGKTGKRYRIVNANGPQVQFRDVWHPGVIYVPDETDAELFTKYTRSLFEFLVKFAPLAEESS